MILKKLDRSRVAVEREITDPKGNPAYVEFTLTPLLVQQFRDFFGKARA